MLASYPPPGTTKASNPSGLRGSWPLLNFPLGRPKENRQTGIAPARQEQTLGRGIVSRRTIDTPSPPARQGFFGSLFPKFDKNDRSPTGPLFYSDKRKLDQSRPRGRRCCGLRVRTVVLLLLLLLIIAAVATIVPILILRHRNSTPPPSMAETTVQECEVSLPCNNGGASILVNTPPQCACLCSAGFTGSTCSTRDSACVPLSTAGGTTNTSIGSAIAPLLQVAASNFSSQFTLNAQSIVDQFTVGNVSCESQNSLVALDGSTSSTFVQSDSGAPVVVAHAEENVVVFEAWTTTTSTTTLILTFTTTLPVVTSSKSSTWTVIASSEQTTTVISRSASSTYSLSTTTISATPKATGLSSGDLVFGRCVILAVVQDLGVSSAAEVQNLLEAAIEHGETFVQDNSTGLSIDLLNERVTGLPAQNGTRNRLRKRF
jgi:hypothetical protein